MRFPILFFFIPVVAIAQSIGLSWQYSSNTLALADANGWPYTFKIYSSSNVTTPMPWPLVYSQSSSNTPITGFDGTSYTYTITNPTVPGQAFFVATVSNIWGESVNSNTSSVPPLPTQLHPKIFKN